MHEAASQALAQVRVVLVEPSHPGNIGGAARALKTMGLTDLAVVNPQRFPDPQAQWRAAGAQDVLEQVQVFSCVADAIADRQWIVGTSTRQRRIPWPLMMADAVAEDLVAKLATTRIAILFGREASGLTNDELQKCHCHLQIPANPDYPSLNLAMAVQIVCYELFKHLSLRDTLPPPWDKPPANAEQTEGLLRHIQQLLLDVGFLDAENPGQTMTRLRRLLTRVAPDSTEVQMLRGILKELGRAGSASGAVGLNDSQPRD